ncbi:hypothetical protein KKC63_02415 [Patescibacteria group bacterium]|nr:hypothetical protein [Patescibacteria group bacterium]MBU4023272.1 hypothetical protein [Patescibacteria group bacterium]MBU4078371.1 hypothetical protein [Patescibacteria group bacterium]
MKTKNKIIILVFILIILIMGIIIFLEDFEYDKHGNGWNVSPAFGITEFLYRKMCIIQNGRGVNLGLSAHFYCDFAFEDAGKECINHEQCRGRCTMGKEDAEIYCPDYASAIFITEPNCENAKGICSKYPSHGFGEFILVNNGFVTRSLFKYD